MIKLEPVRNRLLSTLGTLSGGVLLCVAVGLVVLGSAANQVKGSERPRVRQQQPKSPPAAQKAPSRTREKDADKSGEALTPKDSKEAPLFLRAPETEQQWLPEIFRCLECGYEQDEPGRCPDHGAGELIKIISDARSPLAPVELDGNEDLIVDMPLTGLTIRRGTPADAAGPQTPAKGAQPTKPPAKPSQGKR